MRRNAAKLTALGARIDLARGWMPVRALAKKSGYSTTYLDYIRTGKRNPKYQTLQDIAQALGVHYSWLAFGEGDMK